MEKLLCCCSTQRKLTIKLLSCKLSGGQEGKLSGLFCAVLCAAIVHTELHTTNRTNSSLDWFCRTGPISLCLDSFLCMYYFVSDCICMCSIVTW